MSDPKPVDVHVGRRLRLKRTILGISQETLGKEVGVTFQQIQKYERGINRMGASRLYDFARALGVEVSYFFDGFGDYAVKENLYPGLSDVDHQKFDFDSLAGNREALEVMRAYYRIKSPALRKRIVELIKTMATEENVKN